MKRLLFSGALIFFLPMYLCCQAYTLDTTFGGTGEINTYKRYKYYFDVSYSKTFKDKKNLLISFFARKTRNTEFEFLHLDTETENHSSFFKIIPDSNLIKRYGEPNLIFSDYVGVDSILNEVQFFTNDTGYVTVLFLTDFSNQIDTTFGQGGYVVLSGGQFLHDKVLQKDGKLLIIVPSSFDINPTGRSILARLNRNGQIDTTFGRQGLSYEGKDYYLQIELQSDDKIVTTGGVRNDVVLSNGNLRIKRWLSSGKVDTTFGNRGTVEIPHNSLLGNQEILILPDDKILLYTRAKLSLKTDAMLVRLEKDGNFDLTFGDSGIVILPDFSGWSNPVLQWEEYITDVEELSDGSYLIAGASLISASQGENGFLVKLNPDGKFDTTFGENGVWFYSSPKQFLIKSLVEEASGKIVAVAVRGVEEELAFQDSLEIFLVRYLTELRTGTLDFSTNLSETWVYPNPISNASVLEYTLDQPTSLSIQLLSENGNIIKNYLSNQILPTGTHQLNLDISPALSSGFYFLSIQSAGNKGQTVIKLVKGD